MVVENIQLREFRSLDTTSLAAAVESGQETVVKSDMADVIKEPEVDKKGTRFASYVKVRDEERERETKDLLHRHGEQIEAIKHKQTGEVPVSQIFSNRIIALEVQKRAQEKNSPLYNSQEEEKLVTEFEAMVNVFQPRIQALSPVIRENLESRAQRLGLSIKPKEIPEEQEKKEPEIFKMKLGPENIMNRAKPEAKTRLQKFREATQTSEGK